VSLTGHLGRDDSPVRAFFEEERLGRTGPVVRGACVALRAGRRVAVLPAAPGVNAGRAGTAVDYLLRFALAAEPCPRFGPARQGASGVGEVAAHQRRVTDDEWLRLTQVSCR
jgi:hypothetical protein